MTGQGAHAYETRILVLAPTGRDSELIQTVLGKADIEVTTCSDFPALCRALEEGAGAALLAEEAIFDGERDRLIGYLASQPPWSDLPVLVLTHQGANSPAALRAVDDLGNVTLLERPIRVAALVTGVRFALRARARQYELRSHLAEIQKAAETRALLAAIVESSDDAIVSKTLDGVITSWNAGAERLFEYTAEEAIGRSIVDLVIPSERRGEEEQILRQLRRGLRIHHYETERKAKSGRRVDVSVSVSPIRDEEGHTIGASNVTRDISARKRAEAALKEADRRKDEFLATLAHELRNPLAPIRSSLQTLALAKPKDAVVERAREIMSRQVDHMVRLVDDLLEVSRITRGKIELQLELVDLASVIASAVETSRPLIDASGHELIVSGPREGLLVEGDPVRLSQVFANLLNNAARYTEQQGRIWLTVREEGSEVTVSVRDTGVGIAPEMLPHLFEMFTQGRRSHRRAQDGLGIGLSLVRRLVDMHSGSVSARSEGIGKGSEFLVRLPIAREAQDWPRKPLSAPSFRHDADLSSLRVVVADDNRDAADSLALLLRSLGAEVRIAYDGPSTLDLVAADPPAMVLLDIGMPVMDGYEVARHIRQQPGHDDMILIALTGWGQAEDRQRAREAGFDYHIGKPADVHDLQSLLLSARRSGHGRTMPARS